MCMGGGGSTRKPPQPYRNDPEVKRYYNPDGPGSEWDRWESAYYQYQKDETRAFQRKQLMMQEQFIEMQEGMQEQQMELQERLHREQLEAQERLQGLQQQMEKQQIEAQKKMEEQRLQFEKQADLMQRDSQRKMEMNEKRSDQQVRFQAGREARKRKNAGNLMSSKGTKALQIGLNAGEGTDSGLAIPN